MEFETKFLNLNAHSFVSIDKEADVANFNPSPDDGQLYSISHMTNHTVLSPDIGYIHPPVTRANLTEA